VAAWAGYTRVSRVGDRGDRLISPELQQQRIEGYALIRDLDVEMLPPELDQSGGSADRPILKQVLAGIDDGRYAGIIVAQLDRLSRMDITEALHTIRRIEDAGGEVIAVAENFDARTPEGRMARTMILAMGEMQLDRYKAQFRAAKASAVERGIWPVVTPPFGYTVHHRKYGGDGRLRIDPQNAPKVRRAFERRAAGAPWSEVADVLGGSSTGAGKIIRNRAYLGELRLGEWLNPVAHEAIVDRALWEAAQRKHARPPRGKHPAALLARLVRCSGCQRRMTPNTDAHGRIYRCMPRNAQGRCQAPAIISQAKLDPYVEQAVLGHLGGMRLESSKRTEEIERAMGALNAAEAELAAFDEFTRISDVGSEQFARGRQSRMRAVQAARDDVGRARVLSGPAPEVRDVTDLWDDLRVEQRGHVLRGALSIVWVRKGRGPVDPERVRLIQAGAAPDGLSESGPVSAPVLPLDWPDREDWLEGELRMAGT
jgi:site-specific DNA recombinase